MTPRGLRALTVGVAAACLTLTGCDSVVGIPGDEDDAGDRVVSSSSVTSSAPAPRSGTPAQIAVDAWAADLREHGEAALETRCWSMAPRNMRARYAEPQPILDALARPGVHSGTNTVWKSGAITVVVTDRDAASGYACPRVVPTGGEAFNDADARHTVRRYLSRAIGDPVDPADRESAYPLVCTLQPGWDPDGTGAPGTPPLAVNPGKSGAVKSFVDESINSEWPRESYITVTVPVVTTAGISKKQTYTLKSGDEGYCIGDVSG
ncbi:hypothetical protein OHB26_10870 [Nocardia sp. NBC_01503]|uniref:hypothetical protein n=1 Tax=Nocardia sp. NBC_01503 TaxID=2975997 RepID=UPI002E7BB008|nr:hypothetical protein [Nocardia sp. NBC_01503]WTL34646.1 hypothetical protein OHB26_10870 [Nocardia sp. NBC_01503]